MLAMIGAVWREGGRRRCNRISARALATAFGSEASTFMKRTAPPNGPRTVVPVFVPAETAVVRRIFRLCRGR
jgi:hypothetical protein